VLILAAAAVAAATAGQPSLPALAARLEAAPAWHADFEQDYVPAGFEQGTVDRGRVVLAPPVRLRFDYAAPGARVFAVDGSTARMVDTQADTCDAVALDRETVAGLPLAVLLDPVQAREAFVATATDDVLVLVPRHTSPDVAEIRIAVGADDLPRTFTVIDEVGNRNEFSFTSWKPAATRPPAAFFQPSLPHRPPCSPPPN
jgi:outer membrane lipoprotein carrier protein